jgi:hypothetical protein
VTTSGRNRNSHAPVSCGITWTYSHGPRKDFQAHKIKVVSSIPLGEILRSRNTTGRIVKWSIELGEFNLKFCPRQALKSQIIVDFISEWTETQQPLSTEKPKHWKMYFDGSLNLEVARACVLFISLKAIT